MASNQVVTLIAFAAILLPTIAMAKEFVVGDSTGWTNMNFDYQGWAKDKEFRVGDKLVFKYPVGKHNVLKVNGTAFKECTVPAPNDALTSGNDEVVLDSPGNKWYICGVANHCIAGQKLALTVVDSTSSAVRGVILSGYKVFLAAIVVVVAISV